MRDPWSYALEMYLRNMVKNRPKMKQHTPTATVTKATATATTASTEMAATPQTPAETKPGNSTDNL